jgi:hypothetical protein
MKKKFSIMAFVSLFTVVALCSCSKDDNGDDNGGSGGIHNNTIIASVEDGNSYDGEIDVVKALVITGEDSHGWTGYEAASSTYSNGGFKLNLTATVSDEYLGGEFKNIPDGITVNNPNVKTEWGLVIAYKSDRQIGEFYYGKDCESYLMYANGDLSITGSYTDYDGDLEKYNVHLKKGWNMVYEMDTETKDGKEEYEVTTQAPVGSKWYYDAYSSYYKSSVSHKFPTLLSKRKGLLQF